MSYSRFRHIVSAFVVFIFSVNFIFAQKELTNSEIEQFKKEVSQVATTVKTLQGSFTQTKFEAFLSTPVKSEGEFYYTSAENLIWKYTHPFAMEIVFKNGELSIKENGKTKKINVSSYKMFDKLNDLISNSINGKIIEHNDFDVQFFYDKNFRLTASFN